MKADAWDTETERSIRLLCVEIFRTILKNAVKPMAIYVATILYQKDYCLFIFKSAASKKKD